MCESCQEDPSLHSFRIESDTDMHITYYSCISEATDTIVPRIVSHINGFLQKKGEKTWSWILDSRSFSIHWHTFELTLALFDIISNYETSLVEIKIIHLNDFMKQFMSYCVSYMRESLQQKIVIE